MVNLKKWFVCVLFCLPFFITAVSVQPCKADTLDERVGALAVDTALSSFVDVLPPVETVEEFGGVRGWLAEVGQKFKQAWENDNRNWQSFLDSASTLVSDVFSDNINVGKTVVDDIREVIINAYDFIFGIEKSGSEVPPSVSDIFNEVSALILNSQFVKDNPLPLSRGGIAYAIGDGAQSGDYHKRYISVSSNVNANYFFRQNNYESEKLYGLWSSSADPYVRNYPSQEFLIVYYGNAPTVTNPNYNSHFTFVNVSDSNESVSFSPVVDTRYFNKYYFGFGNSSNVSPSHIVSNYENIYNYVTNNYYTDAVREIKEVPKEYYVSPVASSGNGISIGGFGDVTIELPNADGFESLFGDSDTSDVFAVENSNWLSVLNILPQSVLIMFFIAIAVGCTCVVIKAVK